MTILIDNRTDFIIEEDINEIIKRVIEKTLLYEEFEEECEISISFVDNEEIRKINKQFRRIDSETDVLSFPQLSFEEDEFADVNENNEIILGDIIISIDKAVEQSEEYGHSLKREIAFLTAHSMLHLLGYDHVEKEDEDEMFVKQKEILIKVGIPRK